MLVNSSSILSINIHHQKKIKNILLQTLLLLIVLLVLADPIPNLGHAKIGNEVKGMIPKSNNLTTFSSLPLDFKPGAIAVDDFRNLVYVLNDNGAYLVIIDGSKQVIKKCINLGESGYGYGNIVVDSLEGRIYVIKDHTLILIDSISESIIGKIQLTHGFQVPQLIDFNSITNRLYLSCFFNSSTRGISVIDTKNMSEITTIPLGITPWKIDRSPQDITINIKTNQIYLPIWEDSTVSVIDGNTNTIVATVPVGGEPDRVVVNSITNRIYIMCHGSAQIRNSTLFVLDGNTNKVIKELPIISTNPFSDESYEITIDETLGRLYLIAGGKIVQIIEESSFSVLGLVAYGFGDPAPGDIAINPVSGRLYITDEEANNLSIIDIEKNTLLGTISFKANTSGHIECDSYRVTSIPLYTGGIGKGRDHYQDISALGINWETDKVYIADSVTNTVTIVNCSSQTISGVLEVGRNPSCLAVDVDRNRVYVAAESGIYVIDGQDDSIITIINASYGAPFDMGFNPSNGLIYVTSNRPRDGSIWVFDIVTNTVVEVVPCMAFWENSIEVNPINNKVYVETVLSSVHNLVVESIEAVYGVLPGYEITYSLGEETSGFLVPTIAVYNGSGRTLSLEEILPAMSPHLNQRILMAIDPKANKLYENAEIWRVENNMTTISSNEILTINGETNAIEGSLFLKEINGYRDIVVDHDNSDIYALSGDALIKINGRTGQAIEKYLIPSTSGKIGINQATKIAYVFDVSLGMLSIIEPQKKTPPIAYFYMIPEKPETGQEIVFNASPSFDPDGDKITYYHWDFGDNQTIIGENVLHVYLKNGDYTIHLNIKDEEDRIGQETFLIHVTDKNRPPAILNITADKKVKPNTYSTIIITAQDLDGDSITYDWNCDAGIVSYYENTMRWLSPQKEGIYKINVNVTDGRGGITGTVFSMLVEKTLFPLKIQSILGNPKGAGIYEEGSIIQISVSSRELLFFIFDGWTGDYTSLSTTVNIVMDGPKTVEAKWTLDYPLLGITSIIIIFTIIILIYNLRMRAHA